MIRQVKPEPDLPPAHLYLEDIEEIVEVLTAVEKERGKKFGYGDLEPPLQFIVKNRQCDSIEDLEKIGGRWTHFKVKVGSISFIVNPVSSYCFNSTAFVRVQEIVAARRAKLKNLLLELPWWLNGLLVFVMLEAAQRVVPKRADVLATSVALAAIFAVLILAHFRHTVVELRHSHSKSPTNEKLKGWLERAIWIVLGVALTGVGQMLWSLISKRLH